MADYDVVVIGAGPGGYVAAIRASQLGMSTAVIEDDNVGGVCLNWGCIPSKSLLRNAEVLELVKNAGEYGISVGEVSYDYGKAIDRSRQVVRRLTGGVGSLLRKNGVEHIGGRATLRSANTVSIDGSERAISADNIIIATGARARHIPGIPVDGETVLTSREAIVLREVPRRVVIVGGGAIGVEFADIYHSYGAEVTIVEMLPRLVPLEDEEISQQLERVFRRRGIEYKTGAMVKSVVGSDAVAAVSVTDSDGSETEVECDKVLVAIGVQGNSDGIGLEAAGVSTERGFIPVDDEMHTNVPGVYAIGDVTGKLPLAHVASAQGVTAAEAIAGMNPMPLDYTLMPRATYCRASDSQFRLDRATGIGRRVLLQGGQVSDGGEWQGAGYG